MERLAGNLKIVLDDTINCISEIQQEVIDAALHRLSAYKNTGLEPEEVCAVAGLASDNCCKTANAIDQLLSDDAELDAYRALGPIDHLRELVGAEREGRFPLCAAGTVVQTISGPVKIIGVNMRINGSWYYAYRDKSGSVRGYKSDDFGKTVFLTRAEAEAALDDGYPCRDHECYDRGNYHIGCERCPKYIKPGEAAQGGAR